MLVRIGKRPSHTSLVALLEACHARIRFFAELAVALGRGEARDDEVSERCAEVRRYFREALPLHVADEDESLRPRLRILAPDLEAELTRLHLEHEEHPELLARLDAALASVAAHEAGATARLLAIAVAARDALEQHLRAEESAVFPRLRTLSPEVEAELVAELRARRAGPP